MEARKVKILLFLILFVAGFFRFYKLSEFPAGFHIDEASLGYNAYSLLKTARDENGQFLPLHIDMFGDFRPAGYQYLTTLPVWLFGLTEFATRFMSAFFGVLGVGAIFFLVKSLFENDRLALLAAGLLTLSPWHLVISRASAETIVALFLIMLGMGFFIRGIRSDQKNFIFADIFLFLSLFFYHSSRVFVPMLIVVTTILFYHLWQKKKKAYRIKLATSVLGISLIALFLLFGIKGGSGRFKQVSIFHFPEIRLVMEEQFREDGVVVIPALLARFFHNKLVNYGLGFLKEYFSYFSLNYLFIEGGLPTWYLVPRMGLMYLIELPFLLIGLFQLISRSRQQRLFLIPIVWLILAPVIAGVTRDDVPNVQRSLIMLPALIIITSFGLEWILVWLKKNFNSKLLCLSLGIIIVAFIWQFSYFAHQYFVHSRLHRPWYRFNGFKEMVLEVDKLTSKYDKILVSKVEGGVYMHFLFFQKVDPQGYQALGSPRDRDYQGFGKLVFVPQICPGQELGESQDKILRVVSGQCQEEPFVQGKPIYREDKTVVFRIFQEEEE